MRAALFALIGLAACASAGSGNPTGAGDDDAGPGGPGPGGPGEVIDGSVDAPDAACLDTDLDGVCNTVDKCPGADDNVDTDADTIADGCDNCPGADDRIDANANQIPDCTELMTRTIDLKVVGGNYWRGWHASNNGHMSTNDNTLTGDFTGATYNSYYVFSFAGFTASSVASVTLEMQLELFDSPDATETFSIWDVTTDTNTLENSAGTAAIFQDLQSGTQYATAQAPKANVGQLLTIPLNAAAATAVKAKLGSEFAIGMHLDTAPTWIRFGHTGAGAAPVTTRLVIKYTP